MQVEDFVEQILSAGEEELDGNYEDYTYALGIDENEIFRRINSTPYLQVIENLKKITM